MPYTKCSHIATQDLAITGTTLSLDTKQDEYFRSYLILAL